MTWQEWWDTVAMSGVVGGVLGGVLGGLAAALGVSLTLKGQRTQALELEVRRAVSRVRSVCVASIADTPEPRAPMGDRVAWVARVFDALQDCGAQAVQISRPLAHDMNTLANATSSVLTTQPFDKDMAQEIVEAALARTAVWLENPAKLSRADRVNPSQFISDDATVLPSGVRREAT